MTAAELDACLRSLCKVSEPSVDRIIVGSPDTEIEGIGTCWLPYLPTCKEVVTRGLNVLVAHEPTFYTHWDLEAQTGDYLDAPEAGRRAYLAAVEEKRAWLEHPNLVIIRSHDVPDALPGWGIPFAFGRALGFTNDDIVRSKPYCNVYEVEERPAREVARRLAEKFRYLNQPGVAFYGDPERPVKSVGLGTGYLSDPMKFMDLKPDLFIAVDDCLQTWTQAAYHTDTGHPLVVVHHGAAEGAGMCELSQHLEQAFPTLRVEHFPQGCGYTWITP